MGEVVSNRKSATKSWLKRTDKRATRFSKGYKTGKENREEKKKECEMIELV